MTPQNAVTQGKYVLGSKSAVGDSRRKWEDRVYVGEVQRINDEPLIAGIVADGVGSADYGARGAQLAIDTVLSKIQNSQGSDIPSLLESAIEAANKAVYGDNQENDGDGLTTLVVCIIYKDRCYVGNVGDSRAYWLQANPNKTGKALQLTRDHSYYNIYGGDKDSQEASVVVNAIGKKEQVQVDCGFYLKGDDVDQAYKLGLAGLPLKPGDTILLCSDGLIKTSSAGEPYIKLDEMVEASQTEYMPDMAAIKMVGRAEGRRPDDNVSAVTIQYLSRDLVNEMKSRSERSKQIRILTRVGGVVIALFAVILIGVLSYIAIQTPTTIVITSTPVPSWTPTKPVPAGEAVIQDLPSDQKGDLHNGKVIKSGDTLFSGEDWGIKIVIGEGLQGNDIIYLIKQSAAQINFSHLNIAPMLQNGAIYVQPVKGGTASVNTQWTGVIASVTGSRMIVEQIGNEIWVFCFEGICRLDYGNDGFKIPVGSKQSYNAVTGAKGSLSQMQYDEKWDWNIKCNHCMDEIIPAPTPTPTPTPTPPPTTLPTPTTLPDTGIGS